MRAPAARCSECSGVVFSKSSPSPMKKEVE
jgi:hypothetical protein